MKKYIPLDALVAELEKRKSQNEEWKNSCKGIDALAASMVIQEDINILSFINTLEVKEMDEQKERMSECPYRQVGCTMYKDKILECNGTCSWVVDYPKLKELKTKKEKKILMI